MDRCILISQSWQVPWISTKYRVVLAPEGVPVQVKGVGNETNPRTAEIQRDVVRPSPSEFRMGDDVFPSWTSGLRRGRSKVHPGNAHDRTEGPGRSPLKYRADPSRIRLLNPATDSPALSPPFACIPTDLEFWAKGQPSRRRRLPKFSRPPPRLAATTIQALRGRPSIKRATDPSDGKRRHAPWGAAAFFLRRRNPRA